MMIEDEILKCNGQWSKLIYTLVILMKFLRQVLLLTIILRYFQDNLSGPGVNELLHFIIELLNSSSENSINFVIGLFGISSNKSRLIWQFCTKLNNECKACHRSSSFRHSWPLYWIASIVRSLHFLTQFMSSQGSYFFATISWILISKNVHLVFLMTLLKFFQFLTHFKTLYLLSSLWHSLFHYNFKCFVILTVFECLNQILSVLSVNFCTVHSRISLLEMCSVFSLLIASISSAMKFFSSLLFLTIVCFLVWIYSSIIATLMVSKACSDKSLHSRWIVWLLSSNEFSQRNIRLITEFKLLWLSKYLIEIWLVDLDIHKFIESAMSMRRSQ